MNSSRFPARTLLHRLSSLRASQSATARIPSSSVKATSAALDIVGQSWMVEPRRWMSGDKKEQPHGTASITFEETDDAQFEPNESKHPEESLAGKREDYTVEVIVRMPDMSEEDEENNTIEEWYKQPGDIIRNNDVLCDITTPDFTFGMVTEDEEDALMGEIHVEAGQKADDGAPICTIYHHKKTDSEAEQ